MILGNFLIGVRRWEVALCYFRRVDLFLRLWPVPWWQLLLRGAEGEGYITLEPWCVRMVAFPADAPPIERTIIGRHR